MWHTKPVNSQTTSTHVSQMIDHKKIEDAIDSYFKNTPTAKIIENLDLHSADLDKDLNRENINHIEVDIYLDLTAISKAN